MRRYTVLVVDDYEPFRRAVRTILQQANNVDIVGEAADGLEAVQRALELRPDLVLLDLDLPTLNGFQVARRISDSLRDTKILFLSVESSPEFVERALELGAAYIYKLATAADLVPAIDTVSKGAQFVSEAVKPSSDFPVSHSERAFPQEQSPSRQQASASHEVFFYANDTSLEAGFARFIEATIYRGNVVLVIATEPHRNKIFEMLTASGLDIAQAIREGICMPLDSMDTLSLFMVDGWPDPQRFSTVIGDLMQATVNLAKQRQRRVAVCGELAPILWAQGNRNAAIEIERLWDEMAATHGADTLCGYISATLERDRHARQFDRICGIHSAVHFR
jgi:DNA-binding NarL/FixJ family response regulator